MLMVPEQCQEMGNNPELMTMQEYISGQPYINDTNYKNIRADTVGTSL